MPTGVYPADKCVAGAVEIYNKIIDNADEIISIVEEINLWENLKESNGSTEQDDNKLNKILHIDSELENTTINEMIDSVKNYIEEYAEVYGVDFKEIEPVKILKYSYADKNNAHYDSSKDNARTISALLYLNNVNYGGETEFTHFNINIIPRAGRLVIFPSNYAYTHIAHPPDFGHKYVALFWVR